MTSILEKWLLACVLAASLVQTGCTVGSSQGDKTTTTKPVDTETQDDKSPDEPGGGDAHPEETLNKNDKTEYNARSSEDPPDSQAGGEEDGEGEGEGDGNDPFDAPSDLGEAVMIDE